MREFLIRWLRVPSEPAAPDGAPGSLKIFRAARAFYAWKCLQWGLGQASALVGLVLAFTFVQSDWTGDFLAKFPRAEWLRAIVGALEVLGWVGFFVQLPITWMMVRLEYEMRWYLVTDRSLRIRSGVWVVEELTMTYANVQEITVHQGPIERLLGIANVRVRSAGGGSAGSAEGGPSGEARTATHVAHFRGVAEAEEVRDLIVHHLRAQRGAGLGDPEMRSGEPGACVPPLVLDAARELLGEARALRRAVGKDPAPTEGLTGREGAA
ncbi:MAG: PH domain-containing protein [Verrucomicrobiales bacterium]|nr:PH domain-containing protein [Verrucomicrobiales bacterium]